MKLLLVADSFPPMNSSSAIQLNDLCKEFTNQHHDIHVVFPSPFTQEHLEIDASNTFPIMKIKVPDLRSGGMIRRALVELSLSFILILKFRKTSWADLKFDGVIWYSPSIFLGLFAWYIKYKNNCKGYLILRDIFPDWALDVGILKKNVIYYVFKMFERFQYNVATVIGIQTPGNIKYFEANSILKNKVEVLCNWLTPPQKPYPDLDFKIENSKLSGRQIFVYAGNIGPAQNVEGIVQIAEQLSSNDSIGFLVVGRGSQMERVQNLITRKDLPNILIMDEVESKFIPALYEQCSCGIVSLNSDHKSHNIPGKFVSYIHNALPVFAILNQGNDLAEIIDAEKIGKATFQTAPITLANELSEFCSLLTTNEEEMRQNCKSLSQEMFSSTIAAKQITKALF